MVDEKLGVHLWLRVCNWNFRILNGFMSANTFVFMAGYVYCRYICLVMLVLCLERYVWCTDMLLDFNRASKIQQRPLGYYYTRPQRVPWRNQSFWKMPRPFAMIWDARLRCKFHGLFDEGSGYILRISSDGVFMVAVSLMAPSCWQRHFFGIYLWIHQETSEWEYLRGEDL